MRLGTSRIPALAVASIALCLRLFGIGFGMPLIDNFYIRPDETLISVPAVRMLESSGNPHYFGYPALMMEISAVFYQIRFALLKILGATSAVSISADFGSDMSGYVLISRCLSAVFSVLTVIMTYRLACKIVGKPRALLAAALLAVSPLACRDAHFGVTDSLVTLCGVACIYTLAGYIESGKRMQMCVACVFYGLALSAKYSAATIFPVLFLAVVICCKEQRRVEKVKQLAIGATVPLVVFLLLNPYVVQESRSFLDSMSITIGTLYYSNQSSLPMSTVIRQALTPLKYGPAGMLCIPLMLAAVFSSNKCPTTRRVKWLIAAAFILAFLPAISTKHPVPYRYVLPALPYSAVLVMLGIHAITDRFRAVLRVIVYAGLVLTALGPTLVSCVWTDVLLSRPDSRTLAGEWIAKNVSRDIPVVVAGWPECQPQIPETDASILRRVDFVRLFYGESAVPSIAQPYFMQLRSRAGRSRQGYQLYRLSVSTDAPGDKVCLVVPTYPYTDAAMRIAGIPFLLARFPGRITKRVEIDTLRSESVGHDFDPIDAFYIPANNLSNVIRPGPSMYIYLIDRDRSGRSRRALPSASADTR